MDMSKENILGGIAGALVGLIFAAIVAAHL